MDLPRPQFRTSQEWRYKEMDYLEDMLQHWSSDYNTLRQILFRVQLIAKRMEDEVQEQRRRYKESTREEERLVSGVKEKERQLQKSMELAKQLEGESRTIERDISSLL